MSERKVQTKYYPWNFDPSAVSRSRAPKQTGPRVQPIRLMLPFSLKCTTCGQYIGKGTKFNARKETPLDERYLGIQIYRFYIRCNRCSGEIVFKTDPRNQDYTCEKGAQRNTDPWKRGLGEDPLRGETDEQRLDRLEQEMAEEEERNAMAELEAKTVDAKREMAVADALDEIRSRNARIEKAKREGAAVGVGDSVMSAQDEEKARQEREDEEAARRAFASAKETEQLEEPIFEEADGSPGALSESSNGIPTANAGSHAQTASVTITTPATETTAPSFKRQVKKKKDRAALLGIKKKQPLV